MTGRRSSSSSWVFLGGVGAEIDNLLLMVRTRMAAVRQRARMVGARGCPAPDADVCA